MNSQYIQKYKTSKESINEEISYIFSEMIKSVKNSL